MRKSKIEFDSIVRFSIDMFARGTIPGSEDEAASSLAEPQPEKIHNNQIMMKKNMHRRLLFLII